MPKPPAAGPAPDKAALLYLRGRVFWRARTWERHAIVSAAGNRVQPGPHVVFCQPRPRLIIPQMDLATGSAIR